MPRLSSEALAIFVAADVTGPALASPRRRSWTFLTTPPQYPSQQTGSLNSVGINYTSLPAMQAMKRLKELEFLLPPHH